MSSFYVAGDLDAYKRYILCRIHGHHQLTSDFSVLWMLTDGLSGWRESSTKQGKDWEERCSQWLTAVSMQPRTFSLLSAQCAASLSNTLIWLLIFDAPYFLLIPSIGSLMAPRSHRPPQRLQAQATGTSAHKAQCIKSNIFSAHQSKLQQLAFPSHMCYSTCILSLKRGCWQFVPQRIRATASNHLNWTTD